MKYDHGSRACYVIDRCRCWHCRQANSEYEWRRTTGRAEDRWWRDMQTIRDHITALQAAGYGLRTIADIAGVSRSTITHIMGRSRGRSRPNPAVRILRTTAEIILAIDIPDHDIDWVAVERVLAGDPVPCTQAERIEVIQRWPATGRPLNDLQRLTGWNIFRYLRLLRESS